MMLVEVLRYLLFTVFVTGSFIAIVLFLRSIILLFQYGKKSEGLTKLRNELAYVRTQIRLTQRRLDKRS